VGELLEGLGRSVKQGLITRAFMRAEKASERLGDGEGEQEVGNGQLAGLLVAGPLTGFMVLALRAVAVAAGAMDEMLLTAVGALIQGGAVGTGTAGEQGLQSLSFEPGQGVLGLIIGPVSADDIG
jgi:hypothetical protein